MYGRQGKKSWSGLNHLKKHNGCRQLRTRTPYTTMTGITEKLRDKLLGKTIGVLMGGSSSERNISLKTGQAIVTALKRRGYRVTGIDVNSDIAEVLRSDNIDVAFIALHGSPGEDGTIQGLLEIMGIPYTGSRVLTSAISMNKVTSKKIFFYHGLPTPEFQSLNQGEHDDAKILKEQITTSLPFVIKPAEGGSTIGISIVHKPEDITGALKNALLQCQEIIVEQYIQGRELTVGVLNGEALPPIEIRPKSGFYDYKSKYTGGATQYILPAELNTRISDGLQTLATQAFNLLGCTGAARVDFILSKNNTPFILEINTIPGMTETSLLPMAAQHAGINFDTLTETILAGALQHSKH